jgi:hypothetical protein
MWENHELRFVMNSVSQSPIAVVDEVTKGGTAIVVRMQRRGELLEKWRREL